MLSWHKLPRASFDLETTGRDPQEARIVTASIILVDAAGSIVRHHEWLVDPGVEIPEEAAAIHGITTGQARSEGLAAGEAVQQIIGVLEETFAAGVPVLAFNAAYDFTVLAREAERAGIKAPVPFPVIDPYIMDKQADRYRRGKRTLTAMAAHYGVEFENAHTSAADVMATLGVGTAMAEAFPTLALEAAALHELQTGWAVEQAASFQTYLRRRDPEAVIDGTWPVKPAPDAALPLPASEPVPEAVPVLPARAQAQPARAAVPVPVPLPAALFELPALPVQATEPVLLAEEADGQLVLAITPETLASA